MRSWSVAGVLLFGVALGFAGCVATDGPTDPDAVPGARSSGAGADVLHVGNNPPTLRLRTRPAYDTSTSPVSITGVAPLTVNFNLCESTDPDQTNPDPVTGHRDDINWEFHWGDDGTQAFNADGTFNPNFSGFCREDHEYREGNFVATLSVTDKHLEDQGRDVSAAARDTIRVAVNSIVLPVGNTSNSVETVRSPL